MLEAVIHKIVDNKLLSPDEVVFFEVDVDTERALAAEWNNDGIPFSVFYWNGKQIKIDPKTDKHGTYTHTDMLH
jgi:hypothetical protein